MIALALPSTQDYRLPVTVNPVAGFGDPLENLAHMRPKTFAGAFFVPAMPLYGGRAWETFGSAGFQVSRFANLRTAATHNRLATVRGSSENKLGASAMSHLHALNPFSNRNRIAAYKARAFAALRSDSSLSVRLSRYQSAMEKARALEAQEVRHV